jgi:hypothetical protein
MQQPLHLPKGDEVGFKHEYVCDGDIECLGPACTSAALWLRGVLLLYVCLCSGGGSSSCVSARVTVRFCVCVYMRLSFLLCSVSQRSSPPLDVSCICNSCFRFLLIACVLADWLIPFLYT